MSNQTPNQQLWSQYTEQVAAKLGDGATEAALQVLPSAQLLSGKSSVDIAAALDLFAAQSPQWGTIYNPSPTTLTQAYQTILTQIKETATNGKSIEKQYENEQNQLAQMMGKASSYKTDCIKQYLKTVQTYNSAGVTPPTFSDWFNDNGLQEYKSLLAAQQQQTMRVNTLLKAQGIDSPLVQALADMNDELDKLKNQTGPQATLNPSADLLAGWKTQSTDHNAFSFENSSTQYDYSKTVWKSQTGTELFGFIAIGHRSTTQTQENILDTSSSYALDMEFAANATVTITQGNWFNNSLLMNYKQGPWIPGSQFEKMAAHPYGQGGILPLVVTRVYVVMNPKISITLESKQFQSFYNRLYSSFNKGVSLGPFSFGGNNNKTSSICKTHEVSSKQTITVRDDSFIPQVIAVVNQVMP